MLPRHERTLTSNSAISSYSGISCVSRHYYDPRTLLSGVVYEYFQGEWDTLPDFNHLKPLKIGITSNIYIDAFSELSIFDSNLSSNPDYTEGNFGVRFTCFLKVPIDGVWTFSTTSNDGSCLYLAGKKVVDNDGSHYAVEKFGKLRLSAGVYPLTLLYFHKIGKMMEGIRVGSFLQLNWSCASTNWTIEGQEYSKPHSIPSTFFYYNSNSSILTPDPSIIEQEQTIIYDTPSARVIELEQQLEKVQTHNSARISELEQKIESQQDLMRLILNSVKDLNLTKKKDDEPSPDLEEIWQKHLKNVEYLKCKYFFALGLALKLDKNSPVQGLDLSHIWEKIENEKIPVSEWSKVLNTF